MSDQPVESPPTDAPKVDTVPPAAKPPAPAPKVDVALHDAFTLGWSIVELKSRVQIALADPPTSGLRLASVWRSGFNRIVGLQNQTFPKSATAQTLYEPPPQESLPYLYPPEPDYANIGISGMDANGAAILKEFKLYEVTRRAINCLTLLYVQEDESLIPDVIQLHKDHLVAAILKATQDPGGGGGTVEATGVASEPQNDLQKAKEALTGLTVKFLEAWNGYLRENYYMGGLLPGNDLELVAYEAGRSMSSLSWGVSAATVPLEQQAKASNASPETQSARGELVTTGDTFVKAWQNVFREQSVIRLQHQISALSSALDDAYYLQHPEQKRPADDAVLVAPNPDLPSQAIQAVKRSIDYWQRALLWIPENQDKLHAHLKEDSNPAPWSKPMRLALSDQANIWQTLMTGQQSLRAFNMESVTHKLMEEVTDEIKQSMQADWKGGVQQAEIVMKETAQEAKAAIDAIGKTAVNSLETLFQSCVRFFWPILGSIAALFILLVVVALSKSYQSNGIAAGASGGVGITGVISAIVGYLGLGNLTAKKTEQQAAIQNGKDNAKTVVDAKAAASAASASTPDAGNGNLLTRIEDATHETGTLVLQAFENGYKQIRIELDGLNRSVAVAYPLVEFFGEAFTLASDANFLTDIIWSGTQRADDIKQVLRAAFGPFATFITPATAIADKPQKAGANVV